MGFALTTEAAGLLDAARSSAHRLGHVTVDAFHLIAEICRSAEGRKHLVARRMNPYVFGAAVEAKLAATAPPIPVAGYRSASLPAPSVEVEAAIRRAARRSGWLSRRSASAIELLDALLELPRAKALIVDCEVDATPIERIHTAARESARRWAHGNVLVSHALYGIFDDPALAPDIVLAFEIAGGTAPELRTKVAGILTTAQPCIEVAPVGELVRQAMAHASAARKTDHRLSASSVVVRGLRNEAVQTTVRAIHLDSVRGPFRSRARVGAGRARRRKRERLADGGAP